MKKIIFTRKYLKFRALDGNRGIKLLQVIPILGAQLSREFTLYNSDGHCDVKNSCLYFVLIFQGKGGIFTDLRESNKRNREIFTKSVGENFEVEIKTLEPLV